VAVYQLTAGDAPEVSVPELIEGIHEAGNPYFDYLFGSADVSRAVLTKWLDRDSSEIARHRIRVLAADGAIAGGFVGLSGAELEAARVADMMAILTGTKRQQRAEVRARLETTQSVFTPAEETEFYLSKIWIAAGHRGCGRGRELMDAFVALGNQRGFRRFRLDVHSDNAAAMRLYRSCGFQPDTEATDSLPELTYVSWTAERTE